MPHYHIHAADITMDHLWTSDSNILLCAILIFLSSGIMDVRLIGHLVGTLFDVALCVCIVICHGISISHLVGTYCHCCCLYYYCYNYTYLSPGRWVLKYLCIKHS